MKGISETQSIIPRATSEKHVGRALYIYKTISAEDLKEPDDISATEVDGYYVGHTELCLIKWIKERNCFQLVIVNYCTQRISRV